MRYTQKLMLLFATLFLLTAATVFALNAQADDEKVIPQTWCWVHGLVDQRMVGSRAVCYFCH